MDWYCDVSEDIRGPLKRHNSKKTFRRYTAPKILQRKNWMLVAFPTILWKFLDENNYAVKNDQSFEGKNHQELAILQH